MFANHWIVADMDGTLTPTPSRAHGKYLSLSYCVATGLGYGAGYRSCLPWLRFFIERGGSLCVVSTAGKRMWTQIYQDLAPAVFGFGTIDDAGRCSRVLEASSAASASDAHPHAVAATTTAATTPGTLYMCGFTGAAMFRTRPCHAVWEDMDRLHPGWRTPSSTTAADAADRTTIPPAAVGLEEWAEYRQQAVEYAQASGAAAAAAAIPPSPALPASPSSPFSSPLLSSTTTMDAATHALAAAEARNAIIRFLEHASYVSRHNVMSAAAFFAGCLSTKYHTVFPALLQQLLSEVPPSLLSFAERGEPVPRICFAESPLLSLQALTTDGLYLKETNDALVDVQQVPCADGTVKNRSPVAQVVAMGIPARFFDCVFPSSSPSSSAAAATTTASASPQWQCCAKCAAVGAGAMVRVEAAGLELKSQPNSVCMFRRGVDKGLCVRWLVAEDNKRRKEGSNGVSFDLTKAVAFGDVPESVDRPLTEYPPMQYISLSPKDCAEERLAAMQATPPAQDASPYMYHVGGEEEGTALFLEELLTSCVKDADKGKNGEPRETTWFTPERVAACAGRAQTAVKAMVAERRGAPATGDPSRSTL
ncbi:hypothetical protein ABB37_06673 [Leptomonas pyrrhocoris]|uniref:Uncharacterized protein n=1 Tax=Leptomonas pyrrhocoris TaxID=157538 RepID=A0A0M9FX37_LEPPY|nr:hypothetical protein ABB37_06673 [Leptomonas pyrrhocoris]XP_015656319.1 hypothetical protein ABB37_06673 [Leptomonas pyrrhocoris]KPA77879.1 hypothetical protein ABB37_06673 [Leptomonas pyrrhocoris]KPA77880.1 hypothetical protein ABB37_06673 [Leptomonas pyrrhocoris]|eukprot:XP_015656318.1 hypothetical protein ABB37_06673 [Leptomonas pyrrhocoris]